MILNRWQCWLRTVWLNLIFPEAMANDGMYVSGHRWFECLEKHYHCAVCGKVVDKEEAIEG